MIQIVILAFLLLLVQAITVICISMAKIKVVTSMNTTSIVTTPINSYCCYDYAKLTVCVA